MNENRAEMSTTEKRKKWIFSRVSIREKIEIIYGEFSRTPPESFGDCVQNQQNPGKHSLSLQDATDPPLWRMATIPSVVL